MKVEAFREKLEKKLKEPVRYGGLDSTKLITEGGEIISFPGDRVEVANMYLIRRDGEGMSDIDIEDSTNKRAIWFQVAEEEIVRDVYNYLRTIAAGDKK